MKLITAIIFLSLLACQPKQHIKKATSAKHVYELNQQSEWSFSGKMSFSDGKDGGSGRVSWQSMDGLVTAELKAPLAQGSWSLAEGRNGGKLSSSKHEDRFGPSMESLLSNEIGWDIPWSALKSWITVKPHNLEGAEITELNNNKMTIKENGWIIEYSRFEKLGDKLMPHKIIAKNSPYSIKLFVKSWNL